MIILGKPGAGKTEYVKKILENSAEKYLIISTEGEYNKFGEVIEVNEESSTLLSEKIKSTNVIFNVVEIGNETRIIINLIFHAIIVSGVKHIIIDDFAVINGKEQLLKEPYTFILSKLENVIIVSQQSLDMFNDKKHERIEL